MMRLLTEPRRRFPTFVTMFLLAACSASSQPSASLNPQVVIGSASSFNSSHRPIGTALPTVGQTVQSDRRRSWMAPEAKGDNLLYISDASTYDVNVYSFPSAKLVGQLTGFTEPAGECVDTSGDVFITSSTFYGTGTIFEYAHGGTQPIAALSDPDGYPHGCSIDPTTGNLAVANFNSESSGGDVVIYPDAQGTPTAYTDPSIYVYFFCGYDPSGNLFVDGRSSSNASEFAELLAGQSSFSDISLNQNIGFPGGVQWHSKLLAIGDQDTNVVHRFAIRGGAGHQVGMISLADAGDVVQFWIQGGQIIGPDTSYGDVGFWKYASGGQPLKIITKDLSSPFGAVVSEAR